MSRSNLNHDRSVVGNTKSPVPLLHPIDPIGKQAKEGSNAAVSVGKGISKVGVTNSASSHGGDSSLVRDELKSPATEKVAEDEQPKPPHVQISASPEGDDTFLSGRTSRDQFELRFQDVEDILSSILAEIDHTPEDDVGSSKIHPVPSRDKLSTEAARLTSSSPSSDKGPSRERSVKISETQNGDAKDGKQGRHKRKGALKKKKKRKKKQGSSKNKSRQRSATKVNEGGWLFGRNKPGKGAEVQGQQKLNATQLGTRQKSSAVMNPEDTAAMDRKISWGKAKAYPGSLTLSELNDGGTGTSKTRSLKRLRKKKPDPVAMEQTKPKPEGISLLRSILGMSGPSTSPQKTAGKRQEKNKSKNAATRSKSGTKSKESSKGSKKTKSKRKVKSGGLEESSPETKLDSSSETKSSRDADFSPEKTSEVLHETLPKLPKIVEEALEVYPVEDFDVDKEGAEERLESNGNVQHGGVARSPADITVVTCMRGQVSIEPVVASSSDSIGVRNHPLKGGKITAHRPQAKKSSHDDVTSGNDFKLGQSRDFRLVPATPGYLVERTSHDNVSSQATDKNRVIGKTLPVPQNSASATTTNLLPSEDDTSSSLQSYQQFVRAGCAAPKRQDPPVGLMDLVQRSKSFDSTTSLHDTVPSIRSSTTGLKSPSLIQSVDTRAKNKPSDHGLLSKVVTAEASNPSPSAKSSTTEAADEHGASDNSEDYRSGSSCEGSPSGHGSPRGSGQGSPIGSGQESPRGSGQASPLTSPPKKLTWGKAKSYPGSETVSDLEDDKTSENRSNLQQAKKKLVAVPKGSAKGKNVDKTHMYPPKDKRGKRMNKRSSSKRRLGRDE